MPPTPQPNALSGGGPDRLGAVFWGLVLLTGLVAGLGAGLLMVLLRTVETLAWGPGPGDFLQRVQHATGLRCVLVLLAAGLIVGAMRWLLRRRTGGHGGELAAARWFPAGRLAPGRTLASAVVSIVVVGMGAALGRETAPKQVGALAGSLLSGWGRLPPPQRRLLVACGAGAGIGAVYNVPFGGAVFALEVLLGTLSLELVAPALATALIATATSWLLLPDRATYTIPYTPLSVAIIAWALLVGPVIGLAAVLYVRLICAADAHRPKGRRIGGARLVLAPLLVFSALGLCAIRYPGLLGNGRDLVQQALLDQLGLAALLPLFVLRGLATVACLGSGAPGGLFTPTLACGALLGGALGRLGVALAPGLSCGACALVGATALLAAATQGPLSSIVLVLELTQRIDDGLVPILLAVAGAVVVARRLEARSIYSGRVHQGLARGEAADGEVTLSSAASYATMLRTLLAHPGRRLRVVDEDGRAVGLVSAADAVEPAAALATAGDFAR